MNFRVLFLVMAIVLTALAPAGNAATSYTWKGGTGDWATDTNWEPIGVPSGSNGDTAKINPGTATINLTGSPSANRLELGAGNEVRMSVPGVQFTFSSLNPTMVNDGIFRLSDTGGHANIYTGYTLSMSSSSGSGKIIMESSANSKVSGAYFINGAGHTIEGVGTIEANGMFSNYGNIQATGNRLLMIRNFANYSGGVLSSGPGAVIQMGQSGTTFSYNGSGGWLDINGGLVNVLSASFKNANIRNSGTGGSMELPNTISSSFSFDGNTTVENGAVLNFNNANMSVSKVSYTDPAPVVTNNGVINLKATGGKYSDINYSTATLTGNGRVVLDGSTYTYARLNGTSLTNEVNHTIEGSGTLLGSFINNGTIVAKNGTLYFDGYHSAKGSAISGTGTIKAENGGSLYIQGPYSGAYTVAAGDLILEEGSGLKVYGGSIYFPEDVTTLDVHGDFVNKMTEPAKWNWWVNDTNTKLKMSGTTSEWHFLEVAGTPENNFALRTLEISGNIALSDFYDNQPGDEALYVKNLIFSGSTLNLNGQDLYLNGVLLDIEKLPLEFKDHIIDQPLAPVPPGVLLFGTGLLGLLGWRRFSRS